MKSNMITGFAAGRWMVTCLTLALPLLFGAKVASAEDSVEAGRLVAEDRRKGNCYSCHLAQGAELAGNAGPPLMSMKLRYPQREDLLAQVADPRNRNPNTIMPPYGAHGILTDRELNLVVDYLLSL
ncbi:MAG: sulfur oxidation c-type cytochrome SoxX [Halieaceae bacterium]